MTTPTRTRREAALVGARARWGPQRVLNLGDLSPEKRRLVLALVNMAREADAKSEAEPIEIGPAPAEVRGGSLNDSAA